MDFINLTNSKLMSILFFDMLPLEMRTRTNFFGEIAIENSGSIINRQTNSTSQTIL